MPSGRNCLPCHRATRFEATPEPRTRVRWSTPSGTCCVAAFPGPPDAYPWPAALGYGLVVLSSVPVGRGRARTSVSPADGSSAQRPNPAPTMRGSRWVWPPMHCTAPTAPGRLPAPEECPTERFQSEQLPAAAGQSHLGFRRTSLRRKPESIGHPNEDSDRETADFRHWIPARRRRISDFRRYDGGRQSLIQGPTIEMRLP